MRMEDADELISEAKQKIEANDNQEKEANNIEIKAKHQGKSEAYGEILALLTNKKMEITGRSDMFEMVKDLVNAIEKYENAVLEEDKERAMMEVWSLKDDIKSLL